MIANIDNFEGSFCDLLEPGCYFIEKDGVDYIKFTTFEVEDKTLNCKFEVLKSNYTQDEISELVYVVLLKRFCNNFYLNKASYVKFENIKTNETWRHAYFG